MFKHLLLSITLLMSAPAIALACMNAMYVDGDDAVQQILRAEKLLAQGKNKQAMRLVGWKYRFGLDQQEKARVIRVSAQFRLQTTDDHVLSRGIETLTNMLITDKDNPLLLARLAEGWAFDAKTRSKAKDILEDLAARDLMPDGFAFATLSQLRSQSGEEGYGTGGDE